MAFVTGIIFSAVIIQSGHVDFYSKMTEAEKSSVA